MWSSCRPPRGGATPGRTLRTLLVQELTKIEAKRPLLIPDVRKIEAKLTLLISYNRKIKAKRIESIGLSLPARQAENRFLGFLKGLQIRALYNNPIPARFLAPLDCSKDTLNNLWGLGTE